MRSILVMGSAALLAACSCCTPYAVQPTAETYIKPGQTLTAYRNVIVAAPSYKDGSEDRWSLATRTQTRLSRLGFTLLEEFELSTLSPEQRFQTLVCGITHNYPLSNTRATVTIMFVNVNKEKIFSATGAAQRGYGSAAQALVVATDAALAEVAQHYTGFSPYHAELVANPYSDWEEIAVDRESLRAYLDGNLANLDPIEGIWTEGDGGKYQIGVLRDDVSGERDFVAFILKSSSFRWKPGQVKIELQSTAYAGVFSADYYMEDHARQGTTIRIDEAGMMRWSLRNPADGKEFDTHFVKNYPANAGGSYAAASPHTSTASSGTGFLLTKSGLVATNYHVVEHATRTDVMLPGSDKRHEAEIALRDKANDLAILRLVSFDAAELGVSRPPYRVGRCRNVRVGQSVYTLGYPLGDVLGRSTRHSSGTVSSMTGIQDDPRLLQVSVPLQPGNSGGPLFDDDGELIGVVVSSLNAKYFYERADIIPQNVNFAVKSDYLLSLVSMLPGVEDLERRSNRLQGKSMEDQVEALQPYVVRIETR